MERDVRHFTTHLLHCHFNSHAHVERDAVCEQEIKGYFNFNSHAHVERDVIAITFAPLLFDFNSHAHVERDT